MVTFDMMGPATILVLFSKTVAVAMLALTLLSFGGQFSFWLDNLSNFRLQFALVLLFFAAYSCCVPVIAHGGWQSVSGQSLTSCPSCHGSCLRLYRHRLSPTGVSGSLCQTSIYAIPIMTGCRNCSTRPVVLAGDLNVTMWSPHYIDFIRTSGLTNARDGYGIGGTWPSIPLLGLPIDHILTTKGSWIGDFRVHSGVGSDHLPVSVELTFPDSIKQARYVDAEMR